MKLIDERYFIKSIVQTGPMKEALKSVYLAELIGLSVDQPKHLMRLEIEEAKQKLEESPLIQIAEVSKIQPDTLYIDYTVREPYIRFGDLENAALDREGVVFPLSPFYPPKEIPEIFLGIDGIKNWGEKLQGEKVELAFKILNLLEDVLDEKPVELKRIDLTNASAESFGKREIVVIFALKDKRHILRLSTHSYAQEIGNYLSLSEGLWIEKDEMIIDLRIPGLGFIDLSGDENE